MQEFLVDFQPLGKRVTAIPGKTLLEIAQSTGVGLASVCGGAGTCEECRVRLVSGLISSPTTIEITALGEDALSTGWRLACQTYPRSDIKLYIPPESLTVAQRLQVDGQDSETAIDPIPHKPGAHGFAVDIGTTKLAAYLVNLDNGNTVAKHGAMNPQIAYGEDVVSRIAFAEREKNGLRVLHNSLMEVLNQLLKTMCQEANITKESVLDAVLVGNTVMHHIAANLPITQLGYAPFSPNTTLPLSINASQLGLDIGADALSFLPPVIAGYVGSDHLAMLLAIKMNEKLSSAKNRNKTAEKQNILAIDIGTNTEIALLSRGTISCCSCASGPAFEGAHIQEGMRAAPGALERARWKDGKLIWQTIDALPPIGICGSGILDCIAAILEGGILKTSGKLTTGNSFTIVPATETGLERDLVLTRKDVHEIQLAKSAIRTGIDILLSNNNIKADDLNEFIVAGAFGTYLDTRSAIQVGMFPDLPLNKIKQVGNAAGVGARQMVVSISKRREAESLAKKIKYIELATEKAFPELFMKNLIF